MAEGFLLSNPESDFIKASRTVGDPEHDPWIGISFRSRWKLDEKDGLWYFPYTAFLFILKKVESHWLLYNAVSKQRLSMSKHPFELILFEAIDKGDVAWFLEQGLKSEVIEIR